MGIMKYIPKAVNIFPKMTIGAFWGGFLGAKMPCKKLRKPLRMQMGAIIAVDHATAVEQEIRLNYPSKVGIFMLSPPFKADW